MTLKCSFGNLSRRNVEKTTKMTLGKKTALWPGLEKGFDHTKMSASSFHGPWDGQENEYCLHVDYCRRKETGYAYFTPVWHLLTVLYHLLSMGWTLHYIIIYRVKPDYCWVPTPSVSQLLSRFGTQSGLSSNIAQQNCCLRVLQQLSFIYSDLSPHLSSSLLLHAFSPFFFFFFYPLRFHCLSCFSEGLQQNWGSFYSSGVPEQLWYSHIKLQIENVKWDQMHLKKTSQLTEQLSRLCEATIQVDETK